MNGINKVILVGTITKDPDVKQTSNGSDMANFSLATNESWVDKKTSEKKETTEYHNVVSMVLLLKYVGRLAKVLNFMSKVNCKHASIKTRILAKINTLLRLFYLDITLN